TIDPKVKTAGTNTTTNEQSKVDADKNAEPKETKKYIFKRNGVEEEVDEETYTKYAQKAWAADKTLADAKKMQRELEAREMQLRQFAQALEQQKTLKPSQRVQQMLEELQDNPDALNDFRGSIEQWLLERIDEESASDEVKRAMRAEKELARLQKQKEMQEKQQKELQWKQTVEAQRPQVEKMIIETLKTGRLPLTEWNVKSVADVIYNARVRGIDPKPEQVAQLVKEDRIEHIRALSSGAAKQLIEAQKNKDTKGVINAGESLVELFGEEIIKALRVYDMAVYESRKPNMPRQVVETAKAEPQEKKSYQYRNYDEYLEDRKRRALSTQV
ncbi:MAG: hypothetical protein EBR82_71735, partial [Caulobacteraceae bacterium]|nr:hypothetical protein [Caulobacteraceae bacterium]